MNKSKILLKITSIVILVLSICCVLIALGSLFLGIKTATSSTVSISQQAIESIQTSSPMVATVSGKALGIPMLIFAVIGFILFIFGIKCVNEGSYKPAFVLGTICLFI